MKNDKILKDYKKKKLLVDVPFIESHLKVAANQNISYDDNFEFSNNSLTLKEGQDALLDLSDCDYSSLEINVLSGARLKLKIVDNLYLKDLKIKLFDKANLCFDYQHLNDMHVFNNEISVQNECKLLLNYFCRSSEMAYKNVRVECLGRNSEIDLASLDLLDKNAKYYSLFALDFKDKSNNGEMKLNGIIDDNSVIDLHGQIFISEEANLTDSNMDQEIVVLSKDARALTTPELAIKTNDVKAGHGVSVSKINADKLFYLMSKGISEIDAKNLIVEGYLELIKSRFF